MCSCPTGRQTRCSGEPSRADVNRGRTTLWHVGDRNILKVSQSSVEKHLQQLDTLISLTFGFHRSQAGWCGSHLDWISTCSSLRKWKGNIPFPRQSVRGSTVDIWEQYGAGDIEGSPETTSSPTKGWSSSKGGDVLQWELLVETQRTSPNKYWSLLDQVKATRGNMSTICQERQGNFRIRQEHTHFSLVTRGKLFQPRWAVTIHPQSSPELAPLHDTLVWSLWISLIGEKLPFPGRLQKTLGSVLWYEREQCYGTMERWNSLKGGRGKWNQMWQRCAVVVQSRCLGENENCVCHGIWWWKANKIFGQGISTLCVPNAGLCCHLVAILRNNTSVQVSRISGWFQRNMNDFG